MKENSFKTAIIENPNIKDKFVEYTYSDGADDLILDLSKRRDESVKKRWLQLMALRRVA